MNYEGSYFSSVHLFFFPFSSGKKEHFSPGCCTEIVLSEWADKRQESRWALFKYYSPKEQTGTGCLTDDCTFYCSLLSPLLHFNHPSSISDCCKCHPTNFISFNYLVSTLKFLLGIIQELVAILDSDWLSWTALGLLMLVSLCFCVGEFQNNYQSVYRK